MRSKRRQWKDKRSDFTRRARWFDNGGSRIAEAENIRICFEDTEGSQNHYPENYEEAEALWQRFRNGEIDHRAGTTEPELPREVCPDCGQPYVGMPPCPTCASEVPF